MKKFLLFTLVFASFSIYAQRRSNGWALQARYGLMQGKGDIMGNAVETNLGTSITIGNKGVLAELNLFAQDFSFEHKELKKEIPYQLYGLNVMGGWSYEGIRKLYLNFKAGGFAGYSIVNKGDAKEDVYGTTFVNPVKGITYGVVGSPEVELVIFRKLTATASYTQYFYPNDKWIRWQYTVNAGLKLYF